LGKFDADFGYFVLTLIDVFYGARQSFACGYVRDAEGLSDCDRFAKKEQGAVDIHHEGPGTFTEGGTVFALAGDNHGHGKEDALAAALMSHASGARIVRDAAQGLLLWIFACMRGTTSVGTV